jgi:hypothetical protein
MQPVNEAAIPFFMDTWPAVMLVPRVEPSESKHAPIEARLIRNLLNAIHQGQLDKCMQAIEGGARLDAKVRSETCLHKACSMGGIEIVSMLLKHGADANAKGSRNGSPLHYAAERGHTEVCALLLQYGADVNSRGDLQNTPLHCASRKGFEHTCLVLLARGADLSASGMFNTSAAQVAVTFGHTELGQHLESGIAYLPCTGPALQYMLVWGDQSDGERKLLLNRMQRQWLSLVAEGCGHAQIGATLTSLSGTKRLPARVLVSRLKVQPVQPVRTV